MTKEELYQYLQEPDRLSRKQLPTLEHLLNAYPYAGGIVFLYLYCLLRTEDIRYPSELRRLAIRLPNRSLLYGIAEKNSSYHPATLEHKSETDGFGLIEQFLIEQNASGEQALPSSQEIAFSEDYFATMGLTAEDTVTSKPLASPAKRDFTQPQISEKHEEKTIDKDEEKGEWSDTLFTETLGRIYAKQKRFDKALAVFEAIAGKNSEKSAYFAEQIEYLQLLKENKQEEQSQ